MMYRRFCTALNDKGDLIPAEDSITKHGAVLGNASKEYFTSIFKYNQEQFDEFQKTRTVSGITQVVTDRIVFDFDGKLEDATPAPKIAHGDALEMCNRLLTYGFSEQDIRIFFSGASGFHVEVHLNEDITAAEFKAITRQMSNGLKTYDKKICNASRIFRAVGSVNFKTGLYKIPLTWVELAESTPEIQERAKVFNVDRSKFNWGIVSLPEKVVALKSFKEEYKPKIKEIESQDIDWTTKPKWLSNCRFSLQSGNFDGGERNNTLLCLAATYKNQGFAIEHTYRILKGVAEKQSDRTGQERFSDTEIWNNIISQVYGENWQGGQFSCRELGSWLNEYCLSLGTHKCNHREDEDCFIEIDDFAGKFTNFAQNIDKNRLKFGVPEIDKNVMVTTSMLVGLLGAPSAGKTTLLLNFLEQSNKDKIDSVFFSMDMGLPLVYLRLIQKHFGYSKERVFDIFLNDESGAFEVTQAIKEKYRYTKFSFKTGLTVEKMREAVQDHEQKIGRKVKLVGIDYLERIRGPYSDPTANSGQVSNELTDMANDLDTCNMLLLQTQKQSGDPSDELLSMRNVKGASVIEQSCSVILTLSRPGFSPKNPEGDKFAMISTVKNRMDSLMSVDLAWNGLRGEFATLDYEQQQELHDLRAKKQAMKDVKNDSWG